MLNDSGQLRTASGHFGRLRLQPTLDNSDTKRLWATLDDSEKLRPAQLRLQTTPTPGGTIGSDFAEVALELTIAEVGSKEHITRWLVKSQRCSSF